MLNQLALSQSIPAAVRAGHGIDALRAAYPADRVATMSGAEARAVLMACLAGNENVAAQTARRPYAGSTPPSSAKAAPKPTISLTKRQHDVLLLLAEGYSTKVIARRLDLGVGTVKVHLGGVYRALGTSSRMEAVMKAAKYGLAAQ